MGLLTTVGKWFGVSRAVDLPDDLKMFYGSGSLAGEPVTQQTALQVSAVYACTRILSNTFASLPLHTYRTTTDDQSNLATDHYLYDLLRHKVNGYTTSYRWKQHMMTSLCLTGNHYSQVIFNGRNQVIGLYPMNSQRMKVSLIDGALKYTYDTGTSQVVLSQDEILHIRNLSIDGVIGLSPLDAAKESIGVALGTQKHTATYFNNGATLGNVVKVPALLDTTKAKELEEAFHKKHQGARNAHTTLFLYGGMELAPQTLNFEQLQFLQLKKFTVAEIARIYGVPLHMLGEIDKASNTSIEQQNLEYLSHTLRPVVENVEAEVNTTLLSDRERLTISVEFDFDDFLRADFKTRYDGLAVAVGTPWMTPNEARTKEGLKKVAGGDVLYSVPGSKPQGAPQNTPGV